MSRCISGRVIRHVVPAAETTFSSIMSEPKSLAPNLSATWPILGPIVTQEAWMLGTLSSTMRAMAWVRRRSEEHTSELQSLAYLVCRLLLEKKKNENESIAI